MKIRHLWSLVLTVALSLFIPSAFAAELFYGFDDDSFQGWDYITRDGNEFPLGVAANGWVPWAGTIDIGDGFTLLPATSGNHRIVPFPWETRDCLGGLQCETQILRSPIFMLDGSGDISVDMIGGQLRGGNTDATEEDFAVEVSDLPEFRTNASGVAASQGFALRDVSADEYVLFGFSDVENDGKMRASDPDSRGEWQTVTIPQADLAAFANNGQEYTVDIYDSYLGGWGWIGFDSVRIPGTLPTIGPIIDFDNDGSVDTDDIDALINELGTGGQAGIFDVDGNGTVGGEDVDAWLAVAATSNGFAEPYLAGDANLDGVVNVSDLNSLGVNWQSDNLAWSKGNFVVPANLIDSADLNAIGVHWQESIPVGAETVPEPAPILLLLSGLVLLGLRRR